MSINKKDDHVNLAREFYEADSISDFDNIKFVHNSLPEMGIEDVDTRTSLMGFKLDQPFFINAMTGGSEKTKAINEQLALVARELNIPMASGSLSVAVKDSSLEDSFRIIRKVNKEGLVFANLGAEHSLENAKRAVDMIGADALQIHINTPQELVMPEGDRDFSNWLGSIEKLVANLDLPIMVKEVGFGMSRKTLVQLRDIGVKTVDLGGYGGTNFAKIENFRRDENKYDYLENFGQSTVISLLEAQDFLEDMEIVGTGGVRHPLDIIKILSLGASSVGVAGTILNMLMDEGLDKTIENLNSWKYELRMLMTLVGKKNISELRTSDIIIKNKPKDWCIARGIDYKAFSKRDKY